MKVWLRALVLAVGLAIPRPVPAVVILESVWREEGGGRGREAEGFGAHIRLANEPQFRSLVSVSLDGGDSWGDGSGTWIGNDDSHAYILTSAHVFDDAALDEARFRIDDGSVLRGERLWIHPGYDRDEDWTGVDAAIIRLSRPIVGVGPAPALYSGRAEQGRLITFIGFGTRGIASVGENERFNAGTDKAAAQGVVDEAMPFRPVSDDVEDPGNSLAVFLPREDGRIENPLGGARRPVSRLAGLLGSGDSGGSAWMPEGNGWVIVGINTSGDGRAGYGDSSWFVRVSGITPWIRSVFPGAVFSGSGIPAPPLSATVAPGPVPQPARVEAALVKSVPPGAGPETPPCAARTRVFAFSDEAWYPARARGTGKTGACLVRFDDFPDADDDAFVEPGQMVAWRPDGPGDDLFECRAGLSVVAEEEGVWYPATILRSKGNGCVVRYDDEDYDDESFPLSRLRRLR